jgi:hypothetical protein
MELSNIKQNISYKYSTEFINTYHITLCNKANNQLQKLKHQIKILFYG